jgi:hypothetical protein
MIGLNISSGMNSVVTTHSLIPLILVPQLLFSGMVIKFDQLNGFNRNPNFVPIIGELMHARWGYEAIAVHQYKDNRFYRELFPIDERKSNAEYYSTILIPELVARLNDVEYNHHLDPDQDYPYQGAVLVKNELDKMSHRGIVASFGPIEQLIRGPYEPSLFTAIRDSLARLERVYNRINVMANRQFDRKSLELVERWGGEEAFIQMRKQYTNQRLKELVTNELQVSKITEWNNQLVRKMDPIHMEPLSNTGRAHFYAPHKRLGMLVIDTFWFNVLVIWFSAAILYFTLLFDLLRKFNNWLELRRLRRNR